MNPRLITPDRQRRNIPPEVLILFEDFTNEMLSSFNADAVLDARMRTYAAWELDYRVASDLLVDFAPNGSIRKTLVATESDVRKVEQRDAREAAELHKIADVARRRWSLDGLRKLVKERMGKGVTVG